MTKCCRICMKKFCKKRNTVENCKDCVSEVYLELIKINKIIEEVECEGYKNTHR